MHRFASPFPLTRPPDIRQRADEKLQRSLDHWARDKWHELLRLSGIPLDRGAA